jgi:lipoprotein signal peptidase
VRDFLHMLPRWNLPFGLAWPGGATEVFPWVFNVADVSLLLGLALLYLHSRREERRQRQVRSATVGPVA